MIHLAVDILSDHAVTFGQLWHKDTTRRNPGIRADSDTRADANGLNLAPATSVEGRQKLKERARVKATIPNAAMTFISNNLGEPTLKSILATFDSHEISGNRLLPSDWVSEKTYCDLLAASRRYLESTAGAKQPKDFFFEMGRFIANDGLNKYYKSLIRMFDTRFMLTKSPLLWGLMHSQGSLKVEPIGNTGAYVYIIDFPLPSKEFCYTMAGYMHTVGELTKAKIIRMEELECVTEGAKRCKFIGEWK